VGPPRNVAQIYARLAADVETGSTTAPTFEDALKLHKLVAAIQAASTSGGRVHV
jgi:predicted dehydrogenase